MIVKNKKNGTNILSYRAGIQNVRISIRAGEQVNIEDLEDFNQIINKTDFGNRGWFEVVEQVKIVEKNESAIAKKETNLEKAKKEVKEYVSKDKKKED